MRYNLNQPSQAPITGRYAVRIVHHNRALVCDLVNDEKKSIRKAENIGGHAFDTETRQVWDHKTQSWHSPEDHDAITGASLQEVA